MPLTSNQNSCPAKSRSTVHCNPLFPLHDYIVRHSYEFADDLVRRVGTVVEVHFSVIHTRISEMAAIIPAIISYQNVHNVSSSQLLVEPDYQTDILLLEFPHDASKCVVALQTALGSRWTSLEIGWCRTVSRHKLLLVVALYPPMLLRGRERNEGAEDVQVAILYDLMILVVPSVEGNEREEFGVVCAIKTVEAVLNLSLRRTSGLGVD